MQLLSLSDITIFGEFPKSGFGHLGGFYLVKKSVHIIVSIALNIGFLMYARAVTRSKYQEWHDGFSIAEWLDVFAIPLLLFALGNLLAYIVFREKSAE